MWNFIHLGPVVQKQVNANLGIKLTKVSVSLISANFESQFGSSQSQNFGQNESTGIPIVEL